MIPLITIEGPTGSGKSALAIRLAQELATEIISADSRQVYRYLDIGTAKPSAAELDAVPHHLISIVEPTQSYNVGKFCADAGEVITQLHARGKIPIICGGTGLYVSGLLRGIFPLGEIPEELRLGLQARLSNEGLDVLYSELVDIDPVFAAQVSSRDKQRILRGLEVYQATGTPISAHWSLQEKSSRFKTFRILLDLPRPLLYERIDLRVQNMLESGWLDEISHLLGMGYKDTDHGLNSLGYKELLPHLTAGADLTSCALLAAQHTRNYAKRQCTWYRKHKFDLTLPTLDSIISAKTQLIIAGLN